MQWLNNIVDEILSRHPDGEILIETGSSPSGTYHLGHLRELVTADAIMLEVRRRGRTARHIQFVDDLDALRKIPVNIPADYEKYLGQPLCDIPAPDGSDQSYGDYFLKTLSEACEILGIEVEYVRAHQKYRQGFYAPAIERSLEHLPEVRKTLEEVSGRQLEEGWSPIQILEGKYLKKRSFVSLNQEAKTLVYKDADGQEQTIGYADGKVKLDWRLDFPGRWWLQNVAAEPSGRDHSTKGGSVDTGEQIIRNVFGAEPPVAVPYDFINMVGDTKKMSASKGTGLSAVEGASILPAEVVRYFILRAPASKRLYFDPINGVVQLMDEFAAFAARDDRNDSEEQLLYIATRGITRKTVSRVPFSLLVTSYQAALKNVDTTLEIVGRTEYAKLAAADAEIIRTELKFIDEWLKRQAPDEVKFELRADINPAEFTEAEQAYLKALGDKIAAAPAEADGAWFHQAIYEFRDSSGLEPKDLFSTLYRALIGKTSGPRAGWFLSLLPHDWLVKRLQLEE